MDELSLKEAIILKKEFDKNQIPDITSVKEKCAATYDNTFNQIIDGFQKGHRYFHNYSGYGGGNAGIWEFQLLSIPSTWTKKEGQFYLKIRALNYECIERAIIM